MRILKRLLLMFFCFLLGNNLVVKASSILKVEKVGDKGHDHCQNLGCLSGNIRMLNPNVIEILVTINQNTPNYPFKFPWEIKAFNSEGQYLGRSELIYSSDFSTTSLNNNLREVHAQVFIDPEDILISSLSLECLENVCNEEYSELYITFKLFSGATEINMSCNSFDALDLNENTQIIIEKLRTCECYSSVGLSSFPLTNFSLTENENQFDIKEKPTSHILVKEPLRFINNFDENAIKIFPNPANSHFVLKFGLRVKEDVKIELISMEGKIIQQTAGSPLEKNILLDVSDIQNGSYFLRITANKENHIEKVMIIH